MILMMKKQDHSITPARLPLFAELTKSQTHNKKDNEVNHEILEQNFGWDGDYCSWRTRDEAIT